jgi:hypothetical protein
VASARKDNPIIRFWASGLRLSVAVVVAVLSALGAGGAPVALAAPANDNFSAALTITSPSYTSPVTDTTSATREAGESSSISSCGAFPAVANTHSVWFTFQAAANDWVTLDTLSSTPGVYDTVMEVWTSGAAPAASLSGLTLPSVACNDDAGKTTNKSELTFQVVSGNYYSVMVRDYDSNDTGGSLVLSASFSSVQQVYVDGTNGDDANPGSATFPFKTLSKGVSVAAAGGIVHVAAGAYAEAVTINKNLTLIGTGNPTANSFTLTNGADVSGSIGITAPTVFVDQLGAPGAKIQDGVLLASAGGTVNVAAGTYTQTVTINKNLTLQGASGAVIQVTGGTALTLSGGAVTVNDFSIQGSTLGVSITGGSGHVLFHDNLTGNASGVSNSTGSAVTATSNYWGSNTGPTHPSNAGGVGNTVTDDVTFTPWCTVAAPACTPLAAIPTQLVFITQPGNSSAGVAFPAQPVLRAQDAGGNLGLNFNGAVTMTVGANPGGGSLSGTNPRLGVNGVITFTNLSINAPGLGYTLIASAPALASATSAPFDIINAAPTAVNDAPSMLEDGGATDFQVLSNDTDPNGDVVRLLSIASGPANGAAITLTVGLTDVVRYTPNPDFFGTDTFTYRINDIYGSGVSTGTVTVTVTAVNDAPSFTMSAMLIRDEDAGAQTVPGWATSISPGPSNESGQTVTFTLTNTNNSLFSSQPALNSAGTLTFTPAANKNGSATVFVTATDTGGTSNGGVNTFGPLTFLITVNAVNDAPSFTKGADQVVAEDAGPQSASGWATNIRPGPVSATDESGQALTFLITTTNDSLFAALPAIDPATGNLTYNTVLNASGVVTVGVRLQDDGGTALGGVDTSAAETFVITITPVNDPPMAVDDTNPAAVLEDGGATAIPVLPNDTAANPDAGETLTITAKTNGAKGVVVITGGGTGLTYQPNANSNGVDSFTYTITDSGGLTATATVNLTVTPVNDVPSFSKGANQNVLEDAGAQTVNGWATGTSSGPANEAGQLLTFLITTTNDSLFSALPAVNVATGDLTYTPAPNAFGAATVSVWLHDDGGTSNGGVDTSATQTFTITITGINDAPSFVRGPDQTLLEDAGAQMVAVWAASIVSGPGESQTVTFTVTNTNNSLFLVQPAVNSPGDLTFTLAANANGSAAVFVTATDDGGTANGGVNTFGPLTFAITVTAVNDAPSFTKGPDQSVLEDCLAQTVNGWATALSPGPADEAGQTLSFDIVSNTNSSLFSIQPSVSPTGTLSYTPAPNAYGSATVGVRLWDTGGTANGGVDISATQTFTITLTAVNDPPAAVNDTATLLEDSGANPVAVLPNDNVVNVDVGEVLTITSAGPAANGAVITGTTMVTYTPSADFFGTDVFTYTVTDSGANATATVTVTVTGVNDPPSFTKGPDVTGVPEDGGAQTYLNWATSLSRGAANESGQTLTFVVTNTNNSLFSVQPALNSAGSLMFTPAPNAFGSATVFATLADDGGTGNGGQDTSAPQSFVITITPVNDPPTANNDSASALPDSGANAVNVLANDTSSPDLGETLVISLVTQGAGGTVAITGGGSGLTYTPNPGFAGVDTFTYTISDGNGGVAAATVTVTVSLPTSTIYLPLVMNSAASLPDLVASFSLNPANPTAAQPVTVTVVITNQGSAGTGAFWVDFYVNPSAPPAGPNVPWNAVSSYGIAWYIPAPLGPGQSLTLTSVPGGYCAPPTQSGSIPGAYCNANTIWPGWFTSGAKDLYLFVDSWNPTVATGAVTESDETNNRAERHFLAPLEGGADFDVQMLDVRRPEDLPERPQP